ncbi:UDP-N-acetylmuramoyl-L-alanine--D-glutamate ligase [uncultured Piscinibacter sp.]|uniref:UDP-N-acetylmuramoyl-L-alanine--D-glutamate ligase n=1 Tax=uncultured Piscinibacter sp. TaxID=1131835 RepID=UPI00261826A5|nr:UDP-N-acetylmuramoyl-L-alanine--D-glutamate ligase [uncultured Piscinibacter sp.]
MKHLNDIDVLVLGLGDSGLAMARWCARHGARVRVWDSRESAPQDAALAECVPQALRLRGELTDEAFAGVRLILKSPGLAPTDARIAAPLQRAADTGVLVQGELELFARALADLKAERGYAPKLLAITGTNGKTTTTAMAALLVERAGRRVAMAGNIGPTMLQTLSDVLDRADAAEEPQPLPEVWVLELSSFQLDEAKGFEPDAATVLNISEDHLDWHGSMAAYVAAKARVFGKDAVMVINRDDPAVEKLVPEPVPVKGRGARPIERHVVRFGLDEPKRPGDFGIRAENGMAWLVRAMDADETVKRGKGQAEEELHIQRLMPADALRVRGRHNAANALAALALATAIGCPLAPMLHGLREYGGEPHRVEYVATVNGVDAFDDSKGTNVGATVAALDGLGADRTPAKLVVILGGDGKGQDFAPLRAPLQRHGRAVATIGRDAARLEEALAGIGLPLQRHETLEDAVRWCFQRAHAGDAVLLSPACASLDMFRNYGHRAEVFVATVHALAADQGELSA